MPVGRANRFALVLYHFQRVCNGNGTYLLPGNVLSVSLPDSFLSRIIFLFLVSYFLLEVIFNSADNL